ncbi:MAG TPA: hypothetical protein VK452_05895 [Dissulfurispiraceae bacterium]|nr:hypothetical protein [Dissulfurispiraceae bacterium]
MKDNLDKMKEIVSILMESTLYFDFSLNERKQVVAGLIDRIGPAIHSDRPESIH